VKKSSLGHKQPRHDEMPRITAGDKGRELRQAIKPAQMR
jgi:hypothetical protein